MKTGMDGPQEGNSMQGRKERRREGGKEGRFFHYLIPKEHWPFPTGRPKWRVTAPTARHTKDVHIGLVPDYNTRISYGQGWQHFTLPGRDLVTLISVVLNPFKKIFKTWETWTVQH